MENHFYGNHRNHNPQRPRSTLRRAMPVVPKVVPIPVRHVESKKNIRSDSATKIQKAFRGFLVRKNAKKVLAIEREVNEIERTLEIEETISSIRRDSKERVRFGEMLMNLLFRLDSVKGVDSGIRNLRKAVIKKAIALQEKIDSIPKSDNTEFDSSDLRIKLMSGEEDELRIDDLERMMMENKKMMEKLFERYENQTEILCSLSHRIEQLEKEFVYETVRRMMKRSSAIVDNTSKKCSKSKICDDILINLPVVQL